MKAGRSSSYRLTLSMVVKNEADRYLPQMLERHLPYIDEAVIVDDGSTDQTINICAYFLQSIPHRIVHNESSRFEREHELRKQQWEATIATRPSWILNLDADEQFEFSFNHEIEALLRQQFADVFYFRLFDMWDADHFREDPYWTAHRIYRPFLVRYRPHIRYTWLQTNQHCGRFPIEIERLPYACHPARIQHFGWSNPVDRLYKYERYRQLDPEGTFGIKAQYESILAAYPTLIQWEE
ncbi:glycosyltransferase family 2 protein [Paenibacillus sp. ACRRX]|uniref:glycosyltransferase family 2 protein n=2 Tax=unclassified Paenibacillus TaxID=185978 RepID=UPI001EF6FE13|nr:glycosyltransferase family 2 protein [Paenibacillus sp. ACRRX]